MHTSSLLHPSWAALATSATLALLSVATYASPGPRRAAFVGAHAIDQAAEAAVRAAAGASKAPMTLTPAPLDPRLRLAPCDRPLSGTVTGGDQVHAQTTVAVSCDGHVHWTIYTSVGVESTARVLVARYALPREATLTAADFQLESRRLPGLARAYVRDATAVGGQRLERPLAAGAPLTIDALAPAPLVRRGQQVVLLAEGDGIQVRAAGVALSDGRASDHIRVQNLSSKRIVEGIVRSAGVVETPL